MQTRQCKANLQIKTVRDHVTYHVDQLSFPVNSRTQLSSNVRKFVRFLISF